MIKFRYIRLYKTGQKRSIFIYLSMYYNQMAYFTSKIKNGLFEKYSIQRTGIILKEIKYYFNFLVLVSIHSIFEKNKRK